MKLKKIILIFAAFLIFIPSPAFSHGKPEANDINSSSVSLPNYFYKRFEGQIPGLGTIVINLTREDSVITGNYYFTDTGRPIDISEKSSIDQNGFVYIEGNDRSEGNFKADSVSGIVQGRFVTNNEILGTFNRPGSGNEYSFMLLEKYPSGSAKIEIKNYTKQFGDNGQYPHAAIQFSYPSIKFLYNGPVADSLNKMIIDSLMNKYRSIDTSFKTVSFDSCMNDYIRNYQKFINDLPSDDNGFRPGWTESYSTDVIFNSNNILSLRTTVFRYNGGAHPNTVFIYTNYDLRSGRIINLPEILKGDYQNTLNRLGEAAIRKFYNIDPNETLEQGGLFVADGKFKTNNNFAITLGGLLFQFNQYEIGPYSFGAPEIYIPYSKINNYINMNSLMTPLLK